MVPPDDLEVTVRASGITALSDRIRRNIVGWIDVSSVSDATGALLSALLVGDGELLSDDTRSDYAATGLAHVLAVSGLHVGIVAAIVLMLLWPLVLCRFGRLRILLAIVAVWVYAVHCPHAARRQSGRR